MQQIKILVVEEKKESAAHTQELLCRLGYSFVTCCLDYQDAVSSMRRERPAICFLDVSLLNRKSDATFVEELFRGKISCIFVITQIDMRTIEQMRRIKPRGYVYRPLEEMDVRANVELALGYQRQWQTWQNAIVIPAGKGKEILSFQNILSVKADGNYTEITTNDRKFVIRKNLKEFERSLPLAHPLLRIHKSHMVNKTHIRSYSQFKVRLSNYEEVPVGRTFVRIMNAIPA